ncbi:MAG: hypothetical protein H0X37_03020 [Herpetosiphonaceae bacterium]|nr:hypothetical protein [Herpetosiphonaceae bacterium]
MSDAPLFQNTDDQEAAYAPDELPRGTSGETRAEVDDAGTRNSDAAAGTTGPVVPLGAGALAGGSGSSGLSSGLGGGNPAAGVIAIDAATDARANPRDRDV